MGKFIFGSLLLMAGFFLCITVVGLIVGLPMAFIGSGMMWAGAGQLGWRAVKGGIAAGRAVGKMRQGE